jgi:hypothetical protein
MNCSQCRRFIEDYHDGELADTWIPGVKAHLAECVKCGAEFETLKSERVLFERYRTNREEECSRLRPDWQGLRAGISRRDASESNRGRQRESEGHSGFGRLRFLTGSPLVRQAAFAALLVVLSITGTLLIVNRNHPRPAEPVIAQQHVAVENLPVTADARATGLESAMRAVRRAEQEYLQAIQLLGEIVDRRKPSLDPRMVREMERNLRAIDAGIEATRKAYYERPSDPELAQYMLAAYSKKVELLQELAI